MKTEIIRAVFTNLLFVIGVILVIFGFSRAVLTGVQLVVFDEYPLESYEETRCDLEVMNRPVRVDEEAQVEMSDTENQEYLKKCEASIEKQRKYKLTEDVVASVTTLVSGVFLVYFFRRFIFGKAA